MSVQLRRFKGFIMPKFSANLGFLFTEGASIIEQYELASKCGFRAVEHPFPVEGVDQQKLLETKKQLKLEVVLVNIALDSDAKFGCASLPDRREAFQENFQTTLSFAKLFGCKKIHLMSGKLEQPATKDHHDAFIDNLKFASTFLERENMIGVIEPINHYSVPSYYLHDFSYAIEAIKAVGSANIKLMVDLFHLQMIRGNITNGLKDFRDFIGHVQVAQAPNRNEPNTPGELNLKFILDELENCTGYNDWIGCEYKPLTTTSEGLKWLQNFGYEL